MSKKTYKNVDEYAQKSLDLSPLEIEIIKQKKRIIEILKNKRIKFGISQFELARRIGSTQPAIARMESGMISEVSFDFLAKCAIELDVIIEIGALKKAA